MKKYNNYEYYITHTDQKNQRRLKGFTGGDKSTLLPYVIGGMGDRKARTWTGKRDDLYPQWIKRIIGRSAKMTHEQARLIITDERWNPHAEVR